MYAPQPELRTRSRLPLSRSDSIGLAEFAVLVVSGLGAAYGVVAVGFLKGVPGHAILRAVLPMAAGLACVPRRRAGLTMALVALVGAGGMGLLSGDPPGAGAMTSLVLLGPLLDLAGGWARRRGGLLVAFAVAGMTTNLAALATRGLTKFLVPDGKPLAGWLTRAGWSYPLCGLVAGALAAAICFRLGNRRNDDVDGSTEIRA